MIDKSLIDLSGIESQLERIADQVESRQPTSKFSSESGDLISFKVLVKLSDSKTYESESHELFRTLTVNTFLLEVPKEMYFLLGQYWIVQQQGLDFEYYASSSPDLIIYKFGGSLQEALKKIISIHPQALEDLEQVAELFIKSMNEEAK